jgi:hypothetical protein
VWAEEGRFEYAELDRIDFSDENPWRRKYLEFVRTLKAHLGDRMPVGQPILRGPSDMIAAMRGSSEMVFDLYDRPDEFRRLAERCTEFAIRLVSAQHAVSGPFAGGYLIEQLGLWAPDRLVRLQEDSSALFSPDLYATLLQPWDRRMAEAFPYAAIHLHSSSLFLLDRILDVKALGCIQINKDVGNTAVAEMLPFLQMVQARNRSLLLRGRLDLDDLALLRGSLSRTVLFAGRRETTARPRLENSSLLGRPHPCEIHFRRPSATAGLGAGVRTTRCAGRSKVQIQAQRWAAPTKVGWAPVRQRAPARAVHPSGGWVPGDGPFSAAC